MEEAADAIWNCSVTRFGRINPNKPDAGNWKVRSILVMQWADSMLIPFL